MATPRPQREPYRYRTGRTEQFSARIRPEAYDAFYEIARARGWKIGETALQAFQEKLGEVIYRTGLPALDSTAPYIGLCRAKPGYPLDSTAPS